MIELVVVIIIITILATVSFITINNYIVTTRDAKRQSDITELYKRLDIEYEVRIEDLINVTSTGLVMIGGKAQEVSIGTINFGALRENELNFATPTTRDDDKYKIALSRGTYINNDGQEVGFEFMQLRAINEKDGGYFIVGNYRQIKDKDFVTLFDDGSGLLADNGGNNGEDNTNNEEVNSCHIENGTGEKNLEGDCVVKGCNVGYVISENTCKALEWFTTTWRTGVSGYGNGTNDIWFHVRVPLGSTSTIDWGDGTIEPIEPTVSALSWSRVSHTYTTEGEKIIKIQGITSFSNPSPYNMSNTIFGKLIAVTDWGGVEWSTMSRMFSSADNLIILPSTPPNTSNVTVMGGMFQWASSFNQPVNDWDTSNVTNMASIFSNARSFNQPLNNWDTSNVITMEGMFWSATSFNQNINNWDVSNVTNMNNMFNNATLFNQPLNNWDVGNVTIMSNMFDRAKSFNQNINTWNVSSVETMTNMFLDATSFNQPLNNWNVSNVIAMYKMFNGASSFNQSLDNWNVCSIISGTYSMDNMFNGASSFDQNIHSWLVPNKSSKPTGFDTGTPAGFINNSAKQPQWGVACQ